MFWKEKKPSSTIKKYVLYSRKIRYFPKGLTHDFGQKFELGKIRKFEIGNFPKGLTHDFGQKFELSLLFVFY